MKKYSVLFFTFVLSAFMFFGCGNGNEGTDNNADTVAQQQVNEFDALVKYIEENGNFINSDQVPAMIGADVVNENVENAKFKIIDIRSKGAFMKGHIKHATNVKMDMLLEYFKNEIVPSDYEKIVLVCYSGQSASYAASVLRIVGYNNVFAMKYGMSSWNQEFAKDVWAAHTGSDYVDQLETAGNVKNTKGDYPTLETGKTDPKEILMERAKVALSSSYKEKLVKAEDLFVNGDQYYVMNYWPAEKYDLGHIPGAIQYTPKQSLASTADLFTLPIDKPVVTYCYTGQHAAFVTAYLTILGYNAKALGYGSNSFMHSILKEKEWHAFGDKAVHDYEFVVEEGAEDVSDEGPSCG